MILTLAIVIAVAEVYLLAHGRLVPAAFLALLALPFVLRYARGRDY